MNQDRPITDDIRERARRIKCLILDVDGVLTDGRIVVSSDGSELKFFDVRDGHGLKMVARGDIRLALITARPSPITAARAKELGIEDVFQGSLQKLPSYEELLERRGLKDEEVCFIGDDVVDLPILYRVGLACAPTDAVGEVLEAVHYISPKSGGRGAVRDVCEILLKSQDKWAELMERYGWSPAGEQE